MKIRNGFVSNSSSSSFIVRRWDYENTDVKTFEPKKLLSERKEKLLKNFGFYLMPDNHPKTSVWPDKDIIKGIRERYADCELNWSYSVLCNQEEVIEFLLKNKISFNASIHYDMFEMSYDAKTDMIYESGAYSGEESKSIEMSKEDYLKKIRNYQ